MSAQRIIRRGTGWSSASPHRSASSTVARASASAGYRAGSGLIRSSSRAIARDVSTRRPSIFSTGTVLPRKPASRTSTGWRPAGNMVTRWSIPLRSSISRAACPGCESLIEYSLASIGGTLQIARVPGRRARARAGGRRARRRPRSFLRASSRARRRCFHRPARRGWPSRLRLARRLDLLRRRELDGLADHLGKAERAVGRQVEPIGLEPAAVPGAVRGPVQCRDLVGVRVLERAHDSAVGIGPAAELLRQHQHQPPERSDEVERPRRAPHRSPWRCCPGRRRRGPAGGARSSPRGLGRMSGRPRRSPRIPPRRGSSPAGTVTESPTTNGASGSDWSTFETTSRHLSACAGAANRISDATASAAACACLLTPSGGRCTAR